MKENKSKWLVIAGITLFMLFQIVGGFYSNGGYFKDDCFGSDLRLRRNEIRCIHEGVNPFRIWNHDASLPGFFPYPRPDLEDLPHAETDRPVHAYPPWHAAMFYFYGWIPETMLLAMMSLAFGLCLYFVVGECARIARSRFEHPAFVASMALAIIMVFVWNGFLVLNYGVLILAAFLLMNRALEKGHDVAAGVCWAIMMIKPQVGMLFVWPLFWHRHYWTIVTAVTICLVETFIASWFMHESMIDLILQIPQIGRPYGAGVVVNKVLCPLFGANVMLVIMAFFFALTGALTWMLRRNRDFLFVCIPVVLSIPLWTYSQLHDHVILLPFFMFLADAAFSTRRPFHRWAILICVAYCLALAFSEVWSFVTYFGWFDPTGRGWIYRLVSCVAYSLLILYFAFLFRTVLPERRDVSMGLSD